MLSFAVHMLRIWSECIRVMYANAVAICLQKVRFPVTLNDQNTYQVLILLEAVVVLVQEQH